MYRVQPKSITSTAASKSTHRDKRDQTEGGARGMDQVREVCQMERESQLPIEIAVGTRRPTRR